MAKSDNNNPNVDKFLKLAVAQIGISVEDSSEKVDELTSIFTSLINTNKELQQDLANLPEQPNTVKLIRKLHQQSQELVTKTSSAVIAFQFYDRLCQRLEHVQNSLTKLNNLNGNQLDIESLTSLKQEIYQTFTMQEERELFENIMQGLSVEAAIEAYKSHEQEDDNSIELF